MGSFKTGDKVALRKDYLDAAEEHVSCVRLLKKGYPNVFLVGQVHPLNDFEALTLDGCCGTQLDKNLVPLCAAHPAGLFELVERAAEAQAPEPGPVDAVLDALFKTDPRRFVSVDIPLLGPLLHLGHYESGDTEGIAMRIAGAKPILIAGRDLETVAGLFSQVKAVVDKVRKK